MVLKNDRDLPLMLVCNQLKSIIQPKTLKRLKSSLIKLKESHIRESRSEEMIDTLITCLSEKIKTPQKEIKDLKRMKKDVKEDDEEENIETRESKRK
jgi:hypothetical protein